MRSLLDRKHVTLTLARLPVCGETPAGPAAAEEGSGRIVTPLTAVPVANQTLINVCRKQCVSEWGLGQSETCVDVSCSILQLQSSTNWNCGARERTCAIVAIRFQGPSRVALTSVGPLSVHAALGAASIVCVAFINICKQEMVSVGQMKS